MGVGPQNQTWVCIREIPLGSACNLTTMCFYYWKDCYPVERTTGLGCPSSYDSGQAIYYSLLISSPIKRLLIYGVPVKCAVKHLKQNSLDCPFLSLLQSSHEFSV